MKKYSEIAKAAYLAEDPNYSNGLWAALYDTLGAELQAAYYYYTKVKVTGNAALRPTYNGPRPLAELWLTAYNEPEWERQDVYFDRAAEAVLRVAGGDEEAVAIFFATMYAEVEGEAGAKGFILA